MIRTLRYCDKGSWFLRFHPKVRVGWGAISDDWNVHIFILLIFRGGADHAHRVSACEMQPIANPSATDLHVTISNPSATDLHVTILEDDISCVTVGIL